MKNILMVNLEKKVFLILEATNVRVILEKMNFIKANMASQITNIAQNLTESNFRLRKVVPAKTDAAYYVTCVSLTSYLLIFYSHRIFLTKTFYKTCQKTAYFKKYCQKENSYLYDGLTFSECIRWYSINRRTLK